MPVVTVGFDVNCDRYEILRNPLIIPSEQGSVGAACQNVVDCEISNKALSLV
jgi:hypothetical protein